MTFRKKPENQSLFMKVAILDYGLTFQFLEEQIDCVVQLKWIFLFQSTRIQI